ncbi:hypothetical protein NG798_14320 [Ancylothrix sp. C2]|uniref:hypothetical protein n=1 Tax=Ancylothrix sp. D3o TaxID=2953691 RepID=UPI0021BADE75|nr:hypothetical protein [Ancylothrix sp. D3o]MCT7950971.1 hypothetical protein [Ancylothrix sp. D3o]
MFAFALAARSASVALAKRGFIKKVKILQISLAEVIFLWETNFSLGNFTGTTNRSGSLSESNPIENYNFTVNQTSDFILGLRNLTADADVSGGRALNNNGFIEFDEEIDTSEQQGTVDESLNLKLTPGNYLAKVYLFEDGKNTPDNLDLSLNFLATPTQALGKSLAGATNVGTLNGIDPLTGTLNNAKPSDIYRFNLDENRDFSIFLDGVGNNTNLQLIQDFNNNQIIDSGEVINTATASYTNSGVIAYNRHLFCACPIANRNQL